MTRKRQNRPDRTDAPATVAVPSLRPAPDATTVVLAGGESTHFGPGYEALATPDEESLVWRIVRTLRAVAGRLPIVVIRTTDQRERLAQALPRDWDVRFACGDPGLSGPLAGITTAADTVIISWLFVAGCDTPLPESHTVATLLEYAARSDGGCDRDRDRHVSTSGDRSSSSAIVPVPECSHKPLHALYRRVAVRDNVSELAPDDDFGASLNRLDGVEYVGFDAFPESIDQSVMNVNTRTELAWATTGNEMR